MLKFVCVVSLCLVGALAYVELGEVPVSAQEKADGYACKWKHGLLKEGEHNHNFEKGYCLSAVCYHGNIGLMECGLLLVPPGCTTETDPSKPYPDCCPQVLCP